VVFLVGDVGLVEVRVAGIVGAFWIACARLVVVWMT
jgi:hypothetical protein